MRINRFLAAAGLGSRRTCEDLVTAGRVSVNGRRCETLGVQVEDADEVRVDGRIVREQKFVYILLNKPKGILCTASDERQRQTVFDLLPKDLPRIFCVGRLDKESEGLLLLTNDGTLTMRLTHPRHHIEKEYEVLLDRPFAMEHKAKLLRGFHIEGGRAKMESVWMVHPTKLKVVLTQGIKRQIRLMLYELGYEVKRLQRIRIGSLKLDRLRIGAFRRLSPKEVKMLSSGHFPSENEK